MEQINLTEKDENADDGKGEGENENEIMRENNWIFYLT